MASDPYAILGVSATATDSELRAAYRRMVQRHHPDHNGGSAESERQFEAVQDAWAQIRSQPARRAPDPGVEARLADLERELRDAERRRERAREAAREAARKADQQPAGASSPSRPNRPSDEELGYVKTEDSFAKILADATSELSDRVAEAQREHHVPKRLSDLIDELSSKLTGEPPER